MMNHQLLIGPAILLLSAVACGRSPTQSPATAPTPSSAPNPAQGTVSTTTPSLGTESGIGMGPGCPGGNGIHITATGGTLTDSASGTNQVIGLGQSVDTTMVFNISQRTWTRTNFAAAISVGLADEQRGRYAICAGVTALMPSATLTLQGARGRVHFAASLKDLSNALRVSPTK